MKKNEKILDWLKNISQADIDSIAADIVKQRDEELKASIDFFNCGQFRMALELIKLHLELYPDRSISDSSYSDPIPGLSNEHFIKVFGCLLNKQIVDLDVTYEEQLESVIFEGMVFLQIHGQGTDFVVRKKKEE